LQRLCELAPEEGRRLILAEMRRPEPRVSLKALTQLPDETLPELDNALAGNFERGAATELYSALIARYGSASLWPRISGLLAEKVGRMACYEQARLLAYCLRVDSSSTIPLIRRAVQARVDTHCYDGVLRGVGELQYNTELESLAVEFLNDPDPEVVIDAAALLGQRGSAAVETALWQRLEKWQQEWSGRAAELRGNLRYDEPAGKQHMLEVTLRRALAEAPGWLMDAKKLERLARLCVSAQDRAEVERMKQAWDGVISIGFAPSDSGWGSAEVAHYRLDSLAALKNKLAQFPRGTRFKWQPYNEGQLEEEKEKLFLGLKAFLAERGMRLEK
jgi:hypothetical protein